jgi:hypothetical protein
MLNWIDRFSKEDKLKVVKDCLKRDRLVGGKLWKKKDVMFWMDCLSKKLGEIDECECIGEVDELMEEVRFIMRSLGEVFECGDVLV